MFVGCAVVGFEQLLVRVERFELVVFVGYVG